MREVGCSALQRARAASCQTFPAARSLVAEHELHGYPEQTDCPKSNIHSIGIKYVEIVYAFSCRTVDTTCILAAEWLVHGIRLKREQPL